VILAKEGGKLLCETIQTWIIDESSSFDFQDDTQATFCKKITKGMGEVTIDPRNLPKGNEAYEIYRKICAFDGWPGTFFFYNNKRIKIIKANIANGGNLEIQSVIPEGKKEMNFEVFLKNSH
jgi:methionyl-tRNA formyltransferase